MNPILRYLPEIVNPLDGLWGKAKHGKMHRFTFATGASFTGHDVEKLLRTYGIRIWGREMSTPGERSFLVKQSQAIWAEYIMCRAGVPLTGSLLDPRNSEYANIHIQDEMPRPWSKQGARPTSLVDKAIDLLSRIG